MYSSSYAKKLLHQQRTVEHACRIVHARETAAASPPSSPDGSVRGGSEILGK